jgi:hypothetical protein
MGIINVLKGLGSDKETYNFNGILSENLDLRWKHCKIYLGSQELDLHYEVKEEDVVLIREYPGIATIGIGGILAIVSIVAAGVTGGIAIYKSRQAQREANAAMDRLKNQMKKNGEVDDIPSLSGARNQKAEGKQAPIILGKHLFTPYYLGDPYMVPSGKDGEDLDWFGTFIVGQSGLNIEELRNGSTTLVKMAGDGETTADYQRFVGIGETEGHISVIQKDYFMVDEFNQKWTDSLESTVEIGRKKDDGEKTYEEYIAGGGTGGSNGYQAWLTNYREQKRLAEEDGIHVYDEGPEEIIRQTASFPMKAEIEIFVDGLSGWDSNNGVATNATVEIEIGWATKETGEDWKPIPIDPSSWEGGTKLTRNSQKQMRFLAIVDFPSSIYSRKGTPMYIRAVRNTRMHINGYKDRVYLSAIRTRQYNPKESDDKELVPALNINPSMADKFCRMGIQLKVNKNTEENLDRFNVIASMTGRVWDKDTKKWSDKENKIKTSNPAAVALEVLTGLNHNASKFADDEIDLSSFGRLYEYCENKQVEVEDEGTVTFNLECNGVLTTAAKKSDVLKEILTVCDAGLYVNEFGKKIVYYDDWQTTPIALLNPQRIVTMGETRNFDRRAEGYKVEFVNEDADWATDTHKILRPFVNGPEEEYKWSPIKFVHVTGYYHAMWLARRMMAKEVHRPGEVKVSVGKEGRFFAPGSLLKVQHEGFKHGIGSGEIIQNIVKDGMVIGLRTMEKFNLSKDRDYFVDWYVVDDVRNHVVTRQIQSTGEYTNELLFTTPQPKDGWGDIPIERPDPENSDAPAMFNIVSVIDNIRGGTVTLRESKRYLVADLSETEQGYDLILVQYHENIYETGKITPYVSHIINANPLVLSSHYDTPRYDGANGRGVKSITYKYRVTTASTKPDQVWDDPGWLPAKQMPTPTPTNKYLWFIERILYTDGSCTDTIGLQAVYGDKGDKGDDGDKGDKGEDADITVIWQDDYFGDTLTADTENTGYINGRKVNHGNYVMYSGPDDGTGENRWLNGYMYQWDAIEEKWNQLIRPDSGDVTNGWRYNNAVWDMTDGKGNATYMNAYIRHLQAHTAYIENLFGKIITVLNRIQSEAKDADGNPMWSLDRDGLLRAMNAVIYGTINADSGELNNVTIKENALFMGNIISGPLKLTDETPASNTFPYNIGTRADTIVAAELGRLGIRISTGGGINWRQVKGSYGGSQIIRVGFSGYYDNSVNHHYTVYVIYSNGTQAEIAYYSRYNDTIKNNTLTSFLSFAYTSGGKMFTLTDLPTQDPLTPDVVYRLGKELRISEG